MLSKTNRTKNIHLTERTNSGLSPIRQIFQRIPTLNSERINELGLDPIIDLTIGQPHLPLNPDVIPGLQKQLQQSDISLKFGYSNVSGRPETLDAINSLFELYYQKVKYNNKEVMCTNGANQAIWNALSILIEEKNRKKDIVLTFEPYFGHYSAQVIALGGQLIKIPTSQNNFYPTADALAKTLSQYPGTKVLLLNFPNNPSGINLSPQELENIVSILKSYPGVAIILDEVYRELSFSLYTSLLDIAPEFKERTIVIHSGAKGLLGAPDIRVGMAAGPEAWIEAMCKQQMLATASVSYLSQIALTSAINAYLKNPTNNSWQNASTNEYKSNMKYMIQQLREMSIQVKVDPQGGFYILADASNLIGTLVPNEITVINANGTFITIKDVQKRVRSRYLKSDIDIATYFLHISGVATVPGSGFGIEPSRGLLRISCAANKKTLELAINRLKAACIKLLDQPRISIINQNIPLVESNSIKNNIAIIGVGNIGEWISYMLLTDILSNNINNIGKIYYIGRSTKKLEAKIADLLHSFIISSSYERNVTGISSQDIDSLMEKIIFTENHSVLGDTDYIITAFGAPMTSEIKNRSDLLMLNNQITADIAGKINFFANKNALIINITNPLDVMTWTLQELTGFPTNQVIGISGTLDTSRFAQGIKEVLDIRYQDIDFNSLTVIGEHGPSMVPLLSQARINNRKLLEIATNHQLDLIINFTKSKGTQIMEHMGKVPPHIGTARATLAVLRLILNNDPMPVPCSAWDEQYKIFMGSTVCIENKKIVIKPVEMNQSEKDALNKSVGQIRHDKELIKNLSIKVNEDPTIIESNKAAVCGFFRGIELTKIPNNRMSFLVSKL